MERGKSVHSGALMSCYDSLVRAYGFALGDINRDKFSVIALARSGAPNVLYLSGK